MVEMSVSSQTEVIGVWTPTNITHSDWEALPHDSRGGILIGIQVTAASIAVITVSLRLYTRKFVTRTIGMDDYLMAAVLVMIVAVCIVVVILFSVFQAGHHIWDTKPGNIHTIYKISWGITVVYYAILGTTRFSVLASYIRLFGSIPIFRKIVIISMVVNGCMTISFIVAFILSCRPLYYAWDPYVHPTDYSKCIDEIRFIVASSIMNIVMDFWVCFLPIQPLWRLALPLGQKIITAILLSLGAIACVASILRLRELQRSLITTHSTDPTYDALAYGIYSVLEQNLGAIAASLPPIKALIQRRWPNFLKADRGSMAGREDEQLRTASEMAHISKGSSFGTAADGNLENGAPHITDIQPLSRAYSTP
ncbi:hypothetical protein TWF225_003282 [Orbilia oligospora]|nr:hypothetical protein TWF225_003282 [Orbilia oligospora]KAF3238031.1 hypothetical protein TWF128_000704 [Orbilia oligospora]KAF3267318.1 hypothetical protein TWF217_000389 [Orbilia oligospora]KAF3294335.1 hypothetical protein TWF132_003331 [Orbilia oligospora]